MLTLAGVFDFGVATLVPLWLIVLWWVFAAAIYRSFAKIGQSLWLAAILGGVAVPSATSITVTSASSVGDDSARESRRVG